GLDGEVTGEREVVEGSAPAGGGDVESGQIAAGGAPVPRGPHDGVTVTSSCMIEATCTVCRRREARLLHLVDGWRIVRCTSCSHRYLSPRPSPEEVRRRSADPIRDPEHVPDRVGQVVRRIDAVEPAGR